MVECLVWDQDAAGSSPVASTENAVLFLAITPHFIIAEFFVPVIFLNKQGMINEPE